MLIRSLLVVITILPAIFLYKESIKIGLSEKSVENKELFEHVKNTQNPKELYLNLTHQEGKNIDLENVRNLLSKDVSNGKHLIILLKQYEKQSNDEKSSQIIQLSKSLWPAYSDIRISAAKYWADRTQLENLLEEWSVILTRTRSSETRNEIFKALSTLALNSDYRKLVEPYALNPPKWWLSFFRNLTKHDQSVHLLNHFYSIRKQSSFPITEKERNIFVNQLIKKNHWSQAYFSWLSGLSKQELSIIKDYIYDGSFEGPYQRPVYSWQKSFKWNFTKNKNIVTSIDSTYGADGRKALHVNIRKRKRFNFHHVGQIINLSPGKYEIHYLSRVNNLNTPVGLEWKVRCMEETKKVLGRSKPYKGNQKWTEDSFEINVPQGCSTLMLRLESSSHHAHNQVYLGHLWFDAFRILKGD